MQTLPFERIGIFQPSLLLGRRPDFRIGEAVGRWVFPAVCAPPGVGRHRPIRGAQVAAKMVQVSAIPGKAAEWFALDEIL